jgi:hypothetical protein
MIDLGNRMKTPFALITLVCLFCLAGIPPAVKAAQPMQWERGNAMATVRSVDIDAAVNGIGNISTLADGPATLAKLEQLENRSDWPLPAREAALYEFTRSLAELPRDAVATGVMQHLQAYQARALVPHEDHASTLVPLFNIRGAAAGVENRWQRGEFAVEAASLLETDPAGLVSAYTATSNHNQRSGYLDSLRLASVADVEIVQNAALEQLNKAPALTPLVGLTAVITADTFAIQQLLSNGRGVGLASALSQLAERLSPAESAALLTFAIDEAPPVNASLAIAAWWPGLRHDAVMRDLLVAQLANPALGAAAALALAQGPDIQTIKALQDIADGESVAARRAQMALDMNRDGFTGEALR